jgi:hypothetical protein
MDQSPGTTCRDHNFTGGQHGYDPEKVLLPIYAGRAAQEGIRFRGRFPMAYDVFISYATAQKPLAFQLTEQFEGSQVRCWIAPRNIVSGVVWVDAIMEAIQSSRLMLVLLSNEANKSPQVMREVSQAVEVGIPILPVLVEDIRLSPRMWFWLNSIHWYNAFDRPADHRYEELMSTVKILLSGGTVADADATSDEPLAAAMRPPGAAATAAVDLDSLQVAVDPDAGPPPEEVGQYKARMNTTHPGCFILLVDQSGSMNRRIAGTDIPKRQAVADAVNGLLYEAVLRATGEDGVKHRFDIGVLSYGVGEEGTQSVFGQDLAPITEIARIAKPPQKRDIFRLEEHAGVVKKTVDLPIWFEPFAKGQTFMYAAFERALAAAKEWTSRHPTSFPPIIINITDGGFTRKDPTPLVFEIQELCTQAGNALIFNCHISETDGKVVMYPGPTQASKFEKRMRQLYEMSSVLPELMRARARERGYDVEPGARGYVLHADVASLIEFLEIGGTQAMKL